MVELGPLGPVDPATGRYPKTPATELLNYWAHGPGSEPLRKPATERTYTYVQEKCSPGEAILRRQPRRHRYVVRVAEDHAGRRVARTERYNPMKGSASRTGHGTPERVDLPPLPRSMRGAIAVFTLAVWFIIGALLGPGIILPALAYGLFWTDWLPEKVQRARFARHLAHRDEDLPPLLSEKELDARVFRLTNPDEDRTFDDPAPIPMAKSLRDRAWQRWEEQLPELDDQEYRVGRATYEIKQRNGFSNPTDHAVFELIYEIRRAAALCRDTVTVWNGSSSASKRVHREDDESLRPLFESLGREVLGSQRVAELEDRRRAADHGEPMLDRRFAARTDCADGHVGDHPILSTFTDSNGNKRVRRGCSWCTSTWSELV